MSKTVKAYKAFNADLSCRGFQYEIGDTYTHYGYVAACSGGFHACENPMDVWGYYPIVNEKGALTRYAEVEMSGDMDKDGDKIAAARITIKAEIRMPDFIKRAVAWVIDATRGMGDDPSGDYARIGSSGHSAQIGSSGDYARIGSSGDYAQIGSSGYSARIGSSGYSAQIGSSGHSAQIGSSGDYARIGSSGDSAQIGSSGYSARIGSSGHSARINVSGSGSVVASAGYDTVVTAAAGSWLSLAEYDDDGNCIGFGTGKVEKDGVYRAEGGKLVEV